MAAHMKQALVGMGPVVDVAPIRDFTRCRNAAIEAAWQLVGPSARLNLDRQPIWRVIAAAYLEGVNHGVGIATEVTPFPPHGGSEL